jgi:hypothetical protein
MSSPHTSLKLDLTRHCIETEVRRLHERCIRDYFKQPEDRPRLEAAIDLLREALETFDFPALRACHPALAGQTEHRVALDRDPQGNLRILVDDNPLADLPLK